MYRPEAEQQCNTVEVEGDSAKLICVCNEQHCDELNSKWPQAPGEAILVRSTESGRRFESSRLVEHFATPSNQSASGSKKLRIDLGTRHQTILGWGGAFTDAAAINIANLSSSLAEKLLRSYYGENGLQYNMGRVPIGGSDFSTRAYSYADSEEPDYDLVGWALQPEDLEFKIPLIQKASAAVKQAGAELKLFASPWSPPKWMKTNKDFARGRLIDEDRIYKSYAEYLMKFYDAYSSHNIDFWGATVQNEPILVDILPTYFFNGLQFNSSEQIKFIAEYLGPALEARGLTKDKFKLMVGDDQLGLINIQVPAIMKDERVQKYVSGLAYHWYTSGNAEPYDALNTLYERIKDKLEYVIMTEASAGYKLDEKAVDLGSWTRGESYADDIIEDLHRHTSAWIDWNLALNEKGGPNWSGNPVDSPIIVNSEKNEFYKQPMYYALAQFTRFFKPGSIRVDTKLEDSMSPKQAELTTVAVHNEKTGHLIVAILNKSTAKHGVDISIDGLKNSLRNQSLPTITISEKSINTIVLKL